ncbi:FkbM family methyltransferase [Bacillus hominis]|uniref:FkbM family methyltransferase n=1 Tax=Bacillus hominis TaxID=2817478 RepID=A0ABT7RDI6_9BACI|nr:FkbM family methyltransferase [Bacillus hominis]MDM5195892.1 FkbM family methyltransferase [Bacillus hominis]MDM5435552.1 FkbM family methyltransferase [Bacillus hominis]MDM5441001.1 FkbM family methyltransferase [Bacillus hominis]
MRGVYIGNTKMLISTDWNGQLIVPSNDLSLTPHLLVSGNIEQPLTNFFRNNLKPGDTVVDIGANIGYFSVLIGYLIGSMGKLIAYEANPFMHSFLMDNLSINFLHDRTSVHNLAVYSSQKTLQFYASHRFMGNSSLVKHNETYHKHYVDKIEEIDVKAVSLDEHLKDIDHINFLKIDIEGGEYHAFVGMRELIRHKKIQTIVFELNSTMLQNNFEPFMELLKNLEQIEGNTLYLLSHDGNKIPTNVEHLIKLGGYPHVLMDFI